jgi:cell wall-associated NlpC family hydrolase
MAQHSGAGLALLGAIALSLLANACASGGPAPRPFPSPPSAGVRAPATETPARDPDNPAPPFEWSPLTETVVRTAMDLRGVPYRNGGSDLRGFDCSGFTQYVFANAGKPLPRETREQFALGTAVPLGEQQPGDLIFFTTTAPGASHVAIALGGDGFVHAPSSRGVVRVESLSLPYWSSRLIGIRRMVAD